MTTTYFEALLKKARVPTNTQEITEEFKKISEGSELNFSNSSKYSPFWRLISAIATTPINWLTQFIVREAMPQFFIKTASGEALDMHAYELNVTRKPAVKTTGLIEFTRVSTDVNITIKAGTRIQSEKINGVVHTLETLRDATFESDALTVNVAVKALHPGKETNLAPNYYHKLEKPISGIQQIRNKENWVVQIGADAETDDALRARCVNQFTAVGLFHHDAAYRAIISHFAGIRPDYIFFEHGAPRGAGTANAYILVESGAPDVAFVDTLNQHIRSGYHGHGDDLVCFAIPTQSISLTVNCFVRAETTQTERDFMRDLVEQLIRCAFRENHAYQVNKTLPFSEFSFSTLAAKIHEHSFDIVSIDFNHHTLSAELFLYVLEHLEINIREAHP